MFFNEEVYASSGAAGAGGAEAAEGITTTSGGSEATLCIRGCRSASLLSPTFSPACILLPN